MFPLSNRRDLGELGGSPNPLGESPNSRLLIGNCSATRPNLGESPRFSSLIAEIWATRWASSTRFGIWGRRDLVEVAQISSRSPESRRARPNLVDESPKPRRAVVALWHVSGTRSRSFQRNRFLDAVLADRVQPRRCRCGGQTRRRSLLIKKGSNRTYAQCSDLSDEHTIL